ncbi:serine hydrolase [Nonomuraea monospora]|uniref:serine hydrolase n=1 Tax=Nonomuraea monospora TaxID=568818 RepID=UPI003CD0946E
MHGRSLRQGHRLELHDPLSGLMPNLDGHQLGGVTVHQLLIHTAGLPLRADLRNPARLAASAASRASSP